MTCDPNHSPALAAATVLERRRLHDGWNRLDLVTLEMPVHGRLARFTREVVDHGHGAAVLAYHARSRTAVLVRQLRAGKLVAEGDGGLLEVPAGLVDGTEDPAATARREVSEEIGAALLGLDFVAAAYASGSSLSEKLWLYLGEIDPALPRGTGGGVADEHEEIEIVEMPLADLAAHVDAGRIADMKTVLLVYALRHRRPDLFEG